MPTYTYQCTKCGHRFDLFHSMSDTSEKTCPECGEPAERRMGCGIGFSMKGGSSSHTSTPTPPPRFT